MYMINNKNLSGNKMILLNYVRINELVSRTDICNNTLLSKPTVSRITDELVKNNLLIEVADSYVTNANIGRKPILLKINPKAFYCVGIDIERTSIKGAVLDINRNIITRKEESIKYIKDDNEFMKDVKNVIEKLVIQSKINKQLILGIGISVPCTVDYNTGKLIDYSLNSIPKEIHLKKYLEDKLSIPVYIDNNANIRVLGEYWYGFGRGYKNIIYIMCNHGVGSGIIVEGNILRGKNSVAGEIGHQKIDKNGRTCTCGKKGCLEAYCGTEAICMNVKDELSKGMSSEIRDYICEDYRKITFELINKCASNKDNLCSNILDKAEQTLGIGIANLINILNPEIIICSGEFFKYREDVMERVKEHTKEQLFNLMGDDTRFAYRKDEDILSGVSPAALVFKNTFD
ncbi:transcriptional regulator [Vallitalea longa]|uniref:Transcriptional regulator n=1 Tax=Vallitalea longa TaxID=2936439 RepID=A0A9W5YDT5_9FIRM|nr:ROK family transcriptional regulator [Vallitalea longa]GKX32260.1 transcriptional regulator [Vallitalea longa]